MMPRFLTTAIQRLGSMARALDPPPSDLLLLMRQGAPLAMPFAAADVLPVQPSERREPRRPYLMIGGGLAAVPVLGGLSKYPSVLRLFGMPTAPTTGELGAAIRAAAAASDVRGILLLVDSPGGTVAGTLELAQEVAAAAARKPTFAFAQDNVCSAALWVASQASRLTTNATGHVGSIGTALVLLDSSAVAAAAGLRFIAVTTGIHKAAGEPGLPVTDEQLAALQEMVNEVNGHFLRGVATGRGLSLDQVRALADGRIFIGQRAVDLGLADAVETLDEAISALASAAGVEAGEGLLPLAVGDSSSAPEFRASARQEIPALTAALAPARVSADLAPYVRVLEPQRLAAAQTLLLAAVADNRPADYHALLRVVANVADLAGRGLLADH